MFWFNSKNSDRQKKKAASQDGQKASGCEGGSPQGGQTDKSRRIREEALENARNARLAIGEETLDRIAAAMTKKQQSVLERSKRQINESDPDKVLDELLLMMRNRPAP